MKQAEDVSTVDLVEAMFGDKSGQIEINRMDAMPDGIPVLTDDVKRYLIVKIRLPNEPTQRTHIATKVMTLMEKLGCSFGMRTETRK